MAVDNSGVYVSGVFEDLNGSQAEIFVAKYDLTGGAVWNKSITVVDDSDVPCSHHLAANQLDTDDNGTVYFWLEAQRDVIVLSNQGDEIDRFSTSADLTNMQYFDGYLYATQPLVINDGYNLVRYDLEGNSVSLSEFQPRYDLADYPGYQAYRKLVFGFQKPVFTPH